MKTLIELCQDLIKIKSVTGNETELIKFIENLLEENNIKFERIKVSENKWCLFAVKGTIGKGILFSGHCDTVSETNQWTKKPFDPIIEEDKLFGLGSSDMKCGLGSIIYSFISDKSDNKNGLLITIGEEGGLFEGMRAFCKTKFTELFDYAIIGDTSNSDIVVEQSGLAGIDVTINAKQRHTQNFDEDINPIHEAAKVITKLNEDFKETIKISKFGNKSIMTINKIFGGERDNVIPSECTFSVDRRVSPEENLDDVEDFFKKHLDSVEHLSWKKRFWLNSAKPLENSFVEQIINLGKDHGKNIEKITSNGVSELVFLRDVGIAAVTFGPGLKVNAHVKDEFVLIQDVKDYQKIIQSIMER